MWMCGAELVCLHCESVLTKVRIANVSAIILMFCLDTVIGDKFVMIISHTLAGNTKNNGIHAITQQVM